MSGLFPVVSQMAQDFFPEEIIKIMTEGNFPEGSRTVHKDIVDENGNKIGEKVLHTYSSGRNRPSREIVKASYPPVNIYTDEKGLKVFEFACAGYNPSDISFEINKDDPDYIDLVLSSGVKVDDAKSKKKEKDEEKENENESVRVYDVEGFKVKDARVPFRVDNTRYNIENPTVEFSNGVVRVSFEPKKINFAPKFV